MVAECGRVRHHNRRRVTDEAPAAKADAVALELDLLTGVAPLERLATADPLQSRPRDRAQPRRGAADPRAGADPRLPRVHRECLTTIYAGGLRLLEGARIQIADIDS